MSCSRKLKRGSLGEVSEVGHVAGAEIIDAKDGVALGKESVGEVGAEKAGGAGDENLLHLIDLTERSRHTPTISARGYYSAHALLNQALGQAVSALPCAELKRAIARPQRELLRDSRVG